MKLKFIAVILALLTGCFNLLAEPGKKYFWDTLLHYLYKPVTYILPHYETREVLYETETQYFDIRVEQSENGLRHLIFLPRKGSQSVYDTKEPERIVSKYIDYSLMAFPLLDRIPENILFIGMGGGIMPMIVRRGYLEANIDIVEIDSKIPEIAERYFGFIPDDKMKIIISDGRVYVNKCKKKYDAVFIDVYNANNIPFQFTTVEFYRGIKRILNEGGTCAVNVANMGKQQFIDSEIKTISDVFSAAYFFCCHGKTNYIPIMQNRKKSDYKEFKKSVSKYNRLKKYPIDFDECFKNILPIKEINEIKKSSLLLTDDYAPLEKLE